MTKKVSVRKQALFNTLICVLLLFAVKWLVYEISAHTNLLMLNPESQHDVDFQIEDIFSFSSIDPNGAGDTNIVIINVRKTGRDSLGMVLNALEKMQPKVIGVDIIFEKPSTDKTKDSILIEAVHYPNMVFASRFNNDTSKKTGLITSFFQSGNSPANGYINMYGESAFSTNRMFRPFRTSDTVSFSARIAGRYNEQAYNILWNRNNTHEYINYKRAVNPFLERDLTELFTDSAASAALVHGKIVLLGKASALADDGSLDLEDMHYTPMNPVLYRRCMPDMSGVEVIAHTIQMILTQQYMYKVPAWPQYMLAFCVCFFLQIILVEMHERNFLTRQILLGLIFLLVSVIAFALSWLVFTGLRWITDLTIILIPVWLSGEARENGHIILSRLQKRFGAHKPRTKHA